MEDEKSINTMLRWDFTNTEPHDKMCFYYRGSLIFSLYTYHFKDLETFKSYFINQKTFNRTAIFEVWK